MPSLHTVEQLLKHTNSNDAWPANSKQLLHVAGSGACNGIAMAM